jgi:hypothetical protein
MIKPLTESEVEFTIEIESSDIDPRKEFDDAEMSAKVIADMQFNPWAWCDVKVTARWENWTGVDYLGACSYESEADFKADDYYSDMKRNALETLNASVSRAYELLSTRVSA